MKDGGKTVRWHLDREKGVASPQTPSEHLKAFTVPLRPMLGCIALAPGITQSASQAQDSGRWGGNMDLNEIVEGVTVYLPVSNPGALLYVGDGHAAQGDGEVDQTAIETSLRGRIQLTVRKGMTLKWPRAETATDYIAMATDEDLVKATKAAIQEMIDFLVTEKHLGKLAAYQLTSIAGNVAMTQLVDGKVGVHVKMPKEIFK
jgi:acetamidase/formamidase